MQSRIYLAFLNEHSVFTVLSLALRRKRVLLVDARALFPPARVVIEWLSRRLIGSGLAEDANGSLSQDEIQYSRIWPCSWPDMFSSLELEIEQTFDFNALDAELPEDVARASKHAICAYVDNGLFQVSRLRYFRNRFKGANRTVIGVPDDVAIWYQRYFGIDRELTFERPVMPWRVLNLAAVLIHVARSALWAFSHFHVGPIEKKEVLLGADYIADKRYMYLLRQVTDDAKDVQLIYRNKQQEQEIRADAESQIFEGCLRTDGVVPLAKLAGIVAENIRTTLGLYKSVNRFPNAPCFEILKFPFYQMIYRGLTERYRFANFFGRDDYDSQHIIRASELRKKGVQSIGISHGLPVPETVRGVWRYLDFDIYYTFGTHLYRTHYKTTWAPLMKVKAVGSFGMTREQLSRLGPKPTKDIVYFCGTMPGDEEPFRWAKELARHFPDRKVYIKHKRSNNGRLHEGQAYSRSEEDLPNLIDTSETAYELMLRCQYALSTPNSTIVVEGVQFGLNTFAWDPAYLGTSYYRAFPDLCVSELTQMIERIENIESGKWTYPRQKFSELVDQSGRVIFDVIRADLRPL